MFSYGTHTCIYMYIHGMRYMKWEQLALHGREEGCH